MSFSALHTDLTPAEIAAIIDAHMIVYFASYADLPGAAFRTDRNVQRLVTDLPLDFFNAVLQARLTPQTAEAAIAATVAEFTNHGIPFVWHVGPTSSPDDLPAHLLAQGLVHYEDEPGMVADLSELAGVPLPDGLQIHTVADTAALRDWVTLWAGAVPSTVVESCFQAIGKVAHGPGADHQLLLGLLAGRPVAITELFVGVGVASVQHVMTTPAARRRGIGAAMTHAVLAAARARGYRYAVLTASPQGYGIYSRMGFRTVCKIRRYRPDS